MDELTLKIEQQLAVFCKNHSLLFLGIVDLQLNPISLRRFDEWVGEGRGASMDFLKRYRDVRENPKLILPQAKSIIIFALPYDMGQRSSQPKSPKIAQYAHHRDYHKILKKLGEKMAQAIQAMVTSPVDWRVVTDSAPILERAFAQKSRRGFIGKNTCYIHPDHGSFLLLAELFVSLPLKADTPSKIDPSIRTLDGGCGSCRRCQVNCPTGALDQDYKLDARLCLAYWSIEHRGIVPLKFWPFFKDYWFGCDICQNVCPYNRAGKDKNISRVYQKEQLKSLDLLDIATMDSSYYEQTFAGTPLTRAKIYGLRRNAIIALASQSDIRLDGLIPKLVKDEFQVVRDTVKQIDEFRKVFGAGGGT